MRKVPKHISLMLTVLLVVGCAHASSLPSAFVKPNATLVKEGVVYFSVGIPNIFAAAQNIKKLSDRDLEKFIAVSVVGSDRALARRLMRYMPPKLRGDFVYVGAGNHIVTNNPALLPYVSINDGPRAKVTDETRPGEHPVRISNGSQRYKQDYSSSCSPPNPPGQPHGGYVRQVSKCGFTAGFTFLNSACGNFWFAPGDQGYLYWEVQGRYGSLSEAGLQYNNDQNIQPYVSIQGTRQQMNNAAAKYTCGQDLGVFAGATYDGRYIFSATGGVPCQPEVAFCQGNIFTFNNEAWVFANAPGDITGAGTDNVGTPTPCLNCSISRVTAIAQPFTTYSEDGSYFGITGARENTIHFMQVAFGEWESDCVPGTNLCTGVYSVHPTLYYGGPQYYPNNYDSQSTVQGIPGYGPWESYDGIDLTCCTTKGVRPAVAAFDETLPTYSWRTQTYRDPGYYGVNGPVTATWTDWMVGINGSNFQAYCTISGSYQDGGVQPLAGDCDGNENTDNPGLPYPGDMGY